MHNCINCTSQSIPQIFMLYLQKSVTNMHLRAMNAPLLRTSTYWYAYHIKYYKVFSPKLFLTIRSKGIFFWFFFICWDFSNNRQAAHLLKKAKKGDNLFFQIK